ncbi:GL21333 [Drosophila persimilis]|uniref:Structure-specific endonuclease subunit SLX4 n=1 Tax=Drosophila persimilis TaxID=7234 RepID=B4HAT8_DROPE|nr:GL21333 [Drosophila persimilis]
MLYYQYHPLLWRLLRNAESGQYPKKAPKLKGSSSSAPRRGRGRSKQQPSISNFLRNEQIFAEVAAQHCMADNFSPDDIEMALALSKSEAEKHGHLRLNDDDDVPVDVVEDNAGSATENIRRKLQKYGFRTAAKEDYKSLAVLPGVSGRGSRRCKWTNKFTPLTLRNPEVQQKKLESKVSTLLAQQVRTKKLSAEESSMPPYKLISSILRELKPDSKSAIVHEPSEGPVTDIEIYFVSGLIEVCHTPAHHLLKDWGAIQGRDLSPERTSMKTRQQIKQMEIAFNELENHFENQQALKKQVDEELDELEKLVVENMIEEEDTKQCDIQAEVSSTSSSPLKEPPDKRPRMAKNGTEDLKPTTSSNISVPTQLTRCTSPDLFADSDDEPATSPKLKEVPNFSLKVYKNITISESESPVNEIESTPINQPTASSEVYSISSDEVPDQLEVNGNVYTVRVCHTPKPDFTQLAESEILQQLYNYGIKPLKRKQAVKMLEFIYNQTHPIMQPVEPRELSQRQEDPMPRSKSTPVMSEKPRSRPIVSDNNDVCLTPTEPIQGFKFNTNAPGKDLLRFSQSVPPSLSDDFEFYVLQTNVTKKTPQPIVPLHIAWHNLLCANPKLHESVLMYEPIDLQEVYLHLKQMGHRYEPKDLKCFFDRRCIIFRYELAAPAKQAERHVRKKPRKPTKRS